MPKAPAPRGVAAPMTSAEYRAFVASRANKRPWCNARPTMCRDGHTHASGMEATVCNRLTIECRATGARLFQQVRFPLLSIGTKPTGRAQTICIDFVVVPKEGAWRAIDAKAASRVSRDWKLRAAAFETAHGRKVEETDK